MAFKFTFDRGRKFRKVVRGWKQSLSNLRWFWPAAVYEIARVHEQLFETEGASGRRGRWTDLAEATKRFRERRTGYYGRHVGMAGAEGPILHWTHRLRDSLGDFHREGTMFSIRRFFRTRLVYGSSHPLAYLNHYGIDAPEREVLDEEGSLRAVVKRLQTIIPNQMRTRRGGRFRTMQR